MNHKKQQTRTSRSLLSFGTYAALLVIVAVAFVGMFQTERARSFEDNPRNPPRNNATLPINVSDREQAKQGELLVGEGAPPQNALDVSGDAHVQGNNDSGTAGESATLDLAVDDHDSGVNMPADGILTLWTDNAEEMRIQSDGNVGLGTTDPLNQLTVSGNANVTDNLGTDGASSPSIALAVGDNDTGLENPSSDELSLTTDGTEHVRVKSGGRVGLGTDSPDRRLDVDGNARIGDSLFVNNDAGIGTTSIQNALDVAGDVHIEGNNDSGTAGESATLDLAVDDHDSGVNMPTDDTLTLWTDNAEEMRIQSDGNVGLGTTDPSNQLTVSGDANVTDNLGTDGASSPSIALAVGDNDTGLENPSSDELSITTGGTEHVRVKSDGSVGLGTDSPDRRLDVDGNARIGDSLFVDNDVYADDYYLEDEGEWVSDLTDDMVCEVCIKSVKDDDGNAVDEQCSSSDDGSYSDKSTVPDSTVAKGSQIRIQCRKKSE